MHWRTYVRTNTRSHARRRTSCSPGCHRFGDFWKDLRRIIHHQCRSEWRENGRKVNDINHIIERKKEKSEKFIHSYHPDHANKSIFNSVFGGYVNRRTHHVEGQKWTRTEQKSSNVMKGDIMSCKEMYLTRQEATRSKLIITWASHIY